MGEVEVGERGFDLTEAIVKTVSKGAIEFLKEVVGVTLFPYRNIFSMTKLTFSLRDLRLFVLENFVQCFNLCLRLLQELFGQVKLPYLDILPDQQLLHLRLLGA